MIGCKQVLQGKGLVKPEELRATIEEIETRGQRSLGVELVVKAWMDPSFKARLLQNATKAGAELGIAVGKSRSIQHSCCGSRQADGDVQCQ